MNTENLFDPETALVPAEVNMTAVNIAAPDTAIEAYKAAAEAVVTSDEVLELELIIKGVGIPTDQRSADELGAVTVRIGACTKRLTEFWKTPKDAFFKMHRMITGAEKESLAALSKLDSEAKGNVLKYRQEEQRKAAVAAAEKQRKLDEEQARLRAEAAKAMRIGEVQEAQETVARAEALASAPAVKAEAPKVAGMSFVETWKGSVIDKMALVKAIAEGKVALEVIKEFDQVWLNKQATAYKETMAQFIPGTKADKDDGAKRSSR